MKLDLKVFVLTTVLVLCGCVRALNQDGALTIVPYELEESGRIIVEVRIDDQGPFRFALDTAASISFVFGELRDKLQLVAEAENSVTVHGLNDSGQFPVLSVNRLQVGRESWNDVKIVSIPRVTDATSTIDGVLGIDFLRRYAVGFSSQDRVLRLYPPSLVRNRSYKNWASVPLTPRSIGESREPLYFMDIEIEGKTLPALFDLGSGQNIINWAAARSLGVMPVSPEGYAFLSGALAGAIVKVRFESQEETTQGIGWRNESFLIADLEVFSTLLYDDRPLAILGSGLFNQRDFVIDFVRNRLLVKVGMAEANDSR